MLPLALLGTKPHASPPPGPALARQRILFRTAAAAASPRSWPATDEMDLREEINLTAISPLPRLLPKLLIALCDGACHRTAW
mmetsp:Transcript_8517/g.16504  ORF Transcript_8517/g.16504 Transcript_8517/m.16504 type:complete len:82 (-) Transcript_8517:148-393(-)